MTSINILDYITIFIIKNILLKQFLFIYLVKKYVFTKSFGKLSFIVLVLGHSLLQFSNCINRKNSLFKRYFIILTRMFLRIIQLLKLNKISLDIFTTYRELDYIYNCFHFWDWNGQFFQRSLLGSY